MEQQDIYIYVLTTPPPRTCQYFVNDILEERSNGDGH